MDKSLALAIALFAALSFAAASVLQQRAAGEVPDADGVGAGFLRTLIHRPMWLLGFGADSVGYIAQAVALIPGSIVLVQPVLVTTLLFALPIGARWGGRRLSRADWSWAVVLTASLAIFVVLGDPTAGVDEAPTARWLTPLVAIAGVVVVCVGLGFRSRGRTRALSFAVASGMLYGVTGAMTKTAMGLLDGSIPTILGELASHWETYVLIVAISVGTYLQQAAYQAGGLEQSLPAITVLEPVVAVALGVIVLDERVTASGPIEWAVLAVAVAAMVAGTLALSRSAST